LTNIVGETRPYKPLTDIIFYADAITNSQFLITPNL